ncbi:hypothetical protein E8E13_001016 [Curvularia kusanoi]|uniref:Uncharacterized protein n=1 Tax=Curvularia kusanoi TaxID=90978 RepID=A0A9P4W6H5_CURKU|nr:hypothetical protein E8E13_001016 [Curvularia kusanoi]
MLSAKDSTVDPTTDNDDWMDIDDPEMEATMGTHAETDLGRKQSLVLAAVGLSQADSGQRKLYRSDLSSRRNLFTCLPREIRDMIYEYMTYPPRKNNYSFGINLEEGHSARSLAQTCRQAKAEWDEECARRFCKFLKYTEASYLSETNYRLSFPQELACKDDMKGLRSLKAIIHSPFPDIQRVRLPRSFHRLALLPLDELVIHYTGSYEIPGLTEARRLFGNYCYCFEYEQLEHNPNLRIKHFTLSWNRQNKKHDITLNGRTFEVTHWGKEAASMDIEPGPTRRKTVWGSVTFGQSHNMEMGCIRWTLGSGHNGAVNASQELMYHVSLADTQMLQEALTVEGPWGQKPLIMSYETEIEYKVGEDE